jgi:hypothetical protein
MFRLEAVQSTKGFPVGVLQSGAFSAGAIELKYYAPGTWAVTVSAGSACCDSSGNKFDLYYPTNLGANGFLHTPSLLGEMVVSHHPASTIISFDTWLLGALWLSQRKTSAQVWDRPS